MLRLVRTPLTWMVMAEIVVVTALVLVAWSVVSATMRPPASTVPSLQEPVAAPDTPSPSPDPPNVAPSPGRAPLPGLNLDSFFWRLRLEELNRDQVYLEQLEWRIVHTGVEAMQRYLEAVVVPAVQHAERAG